VFGNTNPLEMTKAFPIAKIILYPSEVLGIEQEHSFNKISECNDFLYPYLMEYDSGPPQVAELKLSFSDNSSCDVKIDMDNDLIGREFGIASMSLQFHSSSHSFEVRQNVQDSSDAGWTDRQTVDIQRDLSCKVFYCAVSIPSVHHVGVSK